MSHYGDFLTRIKDAAEDYQHALAAAAAKPDDVTAHELALALLDVSDLQGWDRLTWTGDADEYDASYGRDEEGNDVEPVPPPSAVDFAKDLLKDFYVVRRPQ